MSWDIKIKPHDTLQAIVAAWGSHHNGYHVKPTGEDLQRLRAKKKTQRKERRKLRSRDRWKGLR